MDKQTDKKNTGISRAELIIIFFLGFIILCIVGYFIFQFAGSIPNTSTAVDPATEKASWGTVDIREYIKNPSAYDGKQLHYIGRVTTISVVDGQSQMIVNVAIPGAGEFDFNLDLIAVYYDGATSGIYQDSIIEFWGYGDEAKEYTTILGTDWTRAYIKAKYLTLGTQ